MSACRFGQPLVAVEHQVHASVNLLRQLPHQTQKTVDCHAVPRPLGADAELHGRIAGVDIGECLFDQLVWILAPIVAAAAGGIEAHLVDRSAGQQLAGAFALDLATQIPERAVDTGHGRVVGPAVVVGMGCDGRIERVFADQLRAEPVDPACDAEWPAVGAGLADSDQPFVSVDTDDGTVCLDGPIAGRDPLAFRLVHARQADGIEFGNLHVAGSK